MLATLSLTVLAFVMPAQSSPRGSIDNDNAVLNVITRSKLGDGHHISSGDGETVGGTFEGAQFYLFKESKPGTHPVYRLYNPETGDHADSGNPAEGETQGYHAEGALGYAFDDEQLGTSGLARRYSAGALDHLTARTAAEPVPDGYQNDGLLGHAYSRPGNECESNRTIQGSEVSLVVNEAAGGAVWQLWWGGKQFINDMDYGRQMQISTFFDPGPKNDNPTEGGDMYGCNVTHPEPYSYLRPNGRAHGSPLLDIGIEGKTLRTVTAPLQFGPEDFGGDREHPVLWAGRFAKQVDLDYGSPNVIRWKTAVTYPSARSVVDQSIVSAWLNSSCAPKDGDSCVAFSKAYMYDATTRKLRLVPIENLTCLGDADYLQDGEKVLVPPAGGNILASDDGKYALGAYRRAEGENGEVGFSLFGFCRYDYPGMTGAYGDSTIDWNVRIQQQGVTAGTREWTVYVVVGTLEKVVSEMNRLYGSELASAR